MQLAFLILLIVVSILLIFFIYLQSGDVKNIGSSIIGTHDVELFENKKRRGTDKILYLTTVLFVALYFIFAILVLVV